MHNIGNPNSSTGHYHKIIARLKHVDPRTVSLIFIFGEIDLRNHILSKSRQKSLHPHKNVDKTIENYFSFLNYLKDKGFKITICGPHCGGGTFQNSISSEIERNNLCAYLNDKLAFECSKNGISFYTLFDIAVNLKTLQNINHLYQDHCHLQLPDNQSNPTGIALSKLACARANAASTDYYYSNPSFYKSEITAICRIIASSIPDFDDKKYAPSVTTLSEKYFLKNQVYYALIELPFGIDIKEVVLVFDVANSPPETVVKAVNEFFNLAEEFERKNIEESTIECENKDGIHLRRHCFESKSLEHATCKYILIKTSSDSDGVRLKSIKIKRRVEISF